MAYVEIVVAKKNLCMYGRHIFRLKKNKIEHRKRGQTIINTFFLSRKLD